MANSLNAVFLLLFYFVPTFVAVARNHQSSPAILVVNLIPCGLVVAVALQLHQGATAPNILALALSGQLIVYQLTLWVAALIWLAALVWSLTHVVPIPDHKNSATVGGIAVAIVVGVCGIGAFFSVMSLVNRQPTVVREEARTSTTQVLVAKTEIGRGQITAPENFRWQDWPASSANTQYIQRSARPNAINDFAGAVARAPLLPGEPITLLKLVKVGDGGMLAAILPSGTRAISTRIKEETTAGRLILPNDRVDVILTQRRRSPSGADERVSDTLFRNIRVLAIGQLIESKGSKKLAEGNTATLELTPTQAEELAAANSKGEISLSLRNFTELKKSDEPIAQKERGEGTKILKYGVETRAYGVN